MNFSRKVAGSSPVGVKNNGLLGLYSYRTQAQAGGHRATWQRRR